MTARNVMSFAVERYYEDSPENEDFLRRFLDLFGKTLSLKSLSKTYFMGEIGKQVYARDFRLSQGIAPGRNDHDTRLKDIFESLHRVPVFMKYKSQLNRYHETRKDRKLGQTLRCFMQMEGSLRIGFMN